VALITSTIRGITTEVLVDERNGLDHPSAIKADELFTLPASLLDQPPVGQLDDDQVQRLDAALRAALELD
jgi:mRNA interferase MazF